MRIAAAVSREQGVVPVIEAVEIEAPRAGEVLVRMVASGVCHTDISINQRPGPRPIVLGHEGGGIVERVGEDVTGLAEGDHVVMSINSCGQCPSCRENQPSYCDEMLARNFGGLRPDGSSPISQDGGLVHARFFGQSSFATYALADARSTVKVTKEVPLELLAPLGCGIQTGAGTVINALQVMAGQSIAVFGCGGVGLSAVMAARLVGAERIIAIDPVAGRRQLAADLGATDTIDPGEGNAVEAIRALVPRGVKFSFNTTTASAVFDQSLECLCQRGTAAFVSFPRTGWEPAMYAMLSGGKSLRGVIEGDSDPQSFIPLMIEYYRQGRFPIDRLIKRYAFADIADAFHDSEAGSTIKPVLVME